MSTFILHKRDTTRRTRILQSLIPHKAFAFVTSEGLNFDCGAEATLEDCPENHTFAVVGCDIHE